MELRKIQVLDTKHKTLSKAYTLEDRKCTYSVTMGRVRATIVVVERKQVLRIMSVCFRQ